MDRLAIRPKLSRWGTDSRDRELAITIGPYVGGL